MTLKKFILGARVILVLTLLIYIPAITAGFIWDDDKFLTENPLIKASNGLYRFWFTTEAPDYFPLTSTSLWIEWRLWGMNASGYHVVNIFLHIVSSLLTWLVLERLKIPGAWLAALIFAVHPVNVESVAWITERKNTLPMVFYMLSILLYLQFESSEDKRFYKLSLGIFLLALLAKTSAVMLPVVLLMCAWWQRGQISRKDIFRSIPFFALSGILSFVTIWFQYNRAIRTDIVRGDDFLSRLTVAGKSVWFYLYKAIVPYPLSFVYPRWETGVSGIDSYFPLLLLAGLMLLFCYYRKGWGRPFLFGLGYFVVTLFPVLGFFDIYFMKFSLVADHWQYFSIISIIALTVGLISRVAEQDRFRRPAIALAVIAVCLLCFKTWTQAQIYKDQESLWEDTLKKNPTSKLALNNMGVIRKQQGKYEEAARHFSAVLETNSDNSEAHYNMGVVLEAQGKSEEAVRHYSEALRTRPNDVEIHTILGEIRKQQGKLDEAVKHYSQVLRIKPSDIPTLMTLGMLLGQLGKTAEAVTQFSEALKLNPDNAVAHFNTGLALAQQGKFEEAVKSYSQALKIKPEYVEAHYNLGIVLARQGNTPKAIEHFSEVVRIDPKNEKAHYGLGIAQRALGDTEKAVKHFSEAVRIKPDYLKAQYYLGAMLEQQGKLDDALRHYAEVLRIAPDFPEKARLEKLLKEKKQDIEKKDG